MLKLTRNILNSELSAAVRCLSSSASLMKPAQTQSSVDEEEVFRPAAAQAEWECSRCTFLNNAALWECEMCGSERPGKQAQPAVCNLRQVLIPETGPQKIRNNQLISTMSAYFEYFQLSMTRLVGK